MAIMEDPMVDPMEDHIRTLEDEDLHHITLVE